MEGEKSPQNKKDSNFDSFLRQKVLVNPYYFGLLLLALAGLNFYHIFVLDRGFGLSLSFFLLYALGESFLEVLSLVVVGNLILRYLHKSVYYIFISLCLVFLFAHFVDFILIRFMDLSFYYGLNIIFDETLGNFIELLHQTGISLNFWIFTAISICIFIPLLALMIYHLTGKIAVRKSISFSQGHLVKTLCCIPISLIVLDLSFSPFLDKNDYRYYVRTLPWKSTLISPMQDVLEFDKPLKPLLSEKNSLKHLHSCHETLGKKPNIYFFIVESLREDFIGPDTARHVDQFRKKNIVLGKTYSNANATQMSWYSIFYANYPFYWESVAKGGWQSGSLPLQLLKKHGYKIHVYSAAQLNYYRLSEVMFGKRHYLADSYQIFSHYFPKETWESDKQVFEAFHQDLDKKTSREGNVFIFFLDSTHFNYSWPNDYPTHFYPICEQKTHLRISNSINNIEMIKNRYRNSIHYIDSLFGEVIDHLKQNKLYDESVILFMGDHGDEFLEEGQLFHASHLSWMQIRPPIYYKLGDNRIAEGRDLKSIISSQVDIFPTVLDYLFGEEPFFDLFQGESIFKDDRFPYAISARHNGSRAPDTFCIHNGKEKLTARFKSFKNIFKQNNLEIIQLQDAHDNPLMMKDREQTKDFIKSIYLPAFNRLFQ